MYINLKKWMLCADGYPELYAETPCSMYSALLAEKLIDNPFFGGNEEKITKLSEKDCVFKTEFEISEDFENKNAILRFNGLDTLCDITLNGCPVCSMDNMHRRYDIDCAKYLRIGKNQISIYFHSPLALLCGNNENEQGLSNFGSFADRTDYVTLFERIIPSICMKYAPEVSYRPSSPSSGGGFENVDAPNCGDQHFWEVWFMGKPFSKYRKYKFRFCSEFGFESYPSIKTIRGYDYLLTVFDEGTRVLSDITEKPGIIEPEVTQIIFENNGKKVLFATNYAGYLSGNYENDYKTVIHDGALRTGAENLVSIPGTVTLKKHLKQFDRILAMSVPIYVTALSDDVSVYIDEYSEDKIVLRMYGNGEVNVRADSGELVFTYGSSKVEISKVQSATWVRDGVQYQLLQTDSTLSRDELTAMVEEILNK